MNESAVEKFLNSWLSPEFLLVVVVSGVMVNIISSAVWALAPRTYNWISNIIIQVISYLFESFKNQQIYLNTLASMDVESFQYLKMHNLQLYVIAVAINIQVLFMFILYMVIIFTYDGPLPPPFTGIQGSHIFLSVCGIMFVFMSAFDVFIMIRTNMNQVAIDSSPLHPERMMQLKLQVLVASIEQTDPSSETPIQEANAPTTPDPTTTSSQ